MQIRNGVTAAALLWLVALMAHTAAQQPPPGAQPPPPPAAPAGAPQAPPGRGEGGRGGQGRGGGRATFPAQQRSLADPAIIARGKTLYEVNCRACHGADLRGGDIGGPNLLRSQLVLNDQHGELILPVVKNGRQNPGMPPMPALPLADDDVKAVAEFIHSVAFTMRGQGSPPPGEEVELNIVVGDAQAGEAYFASRCASCHSATGDLKGIGDRIASPLQLQNQWITGGSGRGGGRGGAPAAPGAAVSRAVTATVTQANGSAVTGRLLRIDDFLVVIATDDGAQRSFRRSGDTPKVQINDPLEGHRKLLTSYADKDIHDVTAYLVTLK
jgi:cytochrome c oxidase cbb3-type subunit 3